MGLVDRVGDPPVIPLVDVRQHQFARHIQPLQLGGGTPARVHQRERLPALGVHLGLVAAQLQQVGMPVGAGEFQPGVVELPAVQGERVLADVL